MRVMEEMNKRYESPHLDVIDMPEQDVVCSSGDKADNNNNGNIFGTVGESGGNQS